MPHIEKTYRKCKLKLLTSVTRHDLSHHIYDETHCKHTILTGNIVCNCIFLWCVKCKTWLKVWMISFYGKMYVKTTYHEISVKILWNTALKFKNIYNKYMYSNYLSVGPKYIYQNI